ncbi:UAP56-interacting factor [Heptranchias perlo]|uniref:UAP56-interacting factor n=1 Tax=Heptranchias perlo TaxID=212740 RepID=UPI003559D7DA
MTEFAAEPAPMEVEKSSEKIDMSLDDIIELNKRETSSTTTALIRTREQQKRQRNFGPRKPQNQLGRGVQQNVQGDLNFIKGPNGPRRNTSGLQGYGRANQRGQTQAKTTRTRPGGRPPTVAAKGVSPLNRKPTVRMDLQQIAPARKGTQRILWGRAQQAQKRFRPTGQGPQIPKRILFQNRAVRQQKKQQTQKQRQTAININRGFAPVGARAGQKKQRTRMWRQQSTSSSILTVSVPNPQANQQAVQRPRIQHPSLTGSKRMTTKAVRKQPKGVYLGFNFNSIANQTNVTLNDRFSSLKIRRRIAASRRGGRTVTLG